MVGEIEHRQNATQRRRVKERRNTNHVPARMDDFDGNAEGQGHRHSQEGRFLRVDASVLSPVHRDGMLPRLALAWLSKSSPPPMKLMFGDSLLSTKPFRPQSARTEPPQYVSPIPFLGRIAWLTHLAHLTLSW
jgi:hypothetical protein